MTTPVVKVDFRPHHRACAVDTAGDGTLTDADFRGCRWIEGNPSPLRSGMFCGLPVAPGESWCPGHRSIVFGENSATDGQRGELSRLPIPWQQNRRIVGVRPSAGRREH